MDVLEKVRTLRSDVEPPTPTPTAAALARLQQAIAGEQHHPQMRRRPRLRTRWTVALTAVAAVAAGVLVAASIVGIDPAATRAHRGGLGVAIPPANAAEVLTSAAKLADTSVPAAPAPGQYLRVETDTATLRTAGPGTDGQFRRGSTASWISHSTQVVYVPANRSDTWIEDDNATPVTTSDEHGTDIRSAIAEAKKTDPKDAYTQSVQYLPRGLFPVTGAPGNRTFSLGTPAGANVEISTIPTDPAKLLAFYQHQLAPAGYGNTTDPQLLAFDNEMAFDQIAADLNSDLLPAPLRAAAFKAIALIPGVKLLTTTNTTSTVELAGTQNEYQITINTSTGLVTRLDAFLDEPDGATQTIGVVPAGTPTISTTVTTSIVKQLPPALRAGLAKASR
ncbi:hypothetical protein ACFOYW_00570 [Gryllotalpicola reticulitermitis]|uniref:CU044_5270 family protein n=1 Tax=Gryllotalpicola reticulitermitis TaxID=1184153 RepID=A0ABV8Q242_9MICO